VYIVSYKRAKTVWRFRRPGAELYFTIVDPEIHRGKQLIMYCPLPQAGRCSQQSKYYQQWVLAKGASPKRRDRMSPTVFEGYWKAKVIRSRETYDGKVRPDNQPGPLKIECLLERVAGGPGDAD